MDRDEAIAWIDDFNARDRSGLYQCANGHQRCSLETGGPCFEELIRQYPDLE